MTSIWSPTTTIRRLDCGCTDRRDHNRWVVFTLCTLHFLGRTPVQDDHAGR